MGKAIRSEALSFIRVYDPQTNTFGSYNSNGTTKTYYKPTSSTYWQRQPGSRIIWDGTVGYTSSKVLKWAGLDKNKKLVDGAVTVGGAV